MSSQHIFSESLSFILMYFRVSLQNYIHITLNIFIILQSTYLIYIIITEW